MLDPMNLISLGLGLAGTLFGGVMLVDRLRNGKAPKGRAAFDKAKADAKAAKDAKR